MEHTTMLAHYNELKKENPDAVILFRCGDFYEAYEDDAETCSKVLGITLTKKNPEGTRMAGFPHHALDNYLRKLIRSAYRVAIADDVPDPNTAKKLVKRGITELIKPGIQMNEHTISMKEHNDQIKVPVKSVLNAVKPEITNELDYILANAMNHVEYIKLKRELKIKLTENDINYLICQAEINNGQ